MQVEYNCKAVKKMCSSDVECFSGTSLEHVVTSDQFSPFVTSLTLLYIIGRITPNDAPPLLLISISVKRPITAVSSEDATMRLYILIVNQCLCVCILRVK